jgi:hypothetical protein
MLYRANVGPVHFHVLLEHGSVAEIGNFSGPNSVLMHQPSSFDIVTAVLGYLGMLAFSPPLDGLDP